MYAIIQRPLIWVGFAIFLGGSAYRLVSMARLAIREKTVFPTMSWHFGLRSIFHWVVLFNSHNMRIHPVMSLVSFLFHACLLVTPLFVMGHAVLWQQSWLGFQWWSLPDGAADLMTLLAVLAGGFLLLRRAITPEVRNVTTVKDALLVLLVIAPFATGYVAHHQWLPYETTLVLHVVFGALWLALIPFTWLAHMLWFVFTRAYMGSEFGAVRHARDW